MPLMPLPDTLAPFCNTALASCPVTTMLPEKGSPRLDCTFTPPMPATALNDVISDSDTAIIFVFVFKIHLPIRANARKRIDTKLNNS